MLLNITSTFSGSKLSPLYPIAQRTLRESAEADFGCCGGDGKGIIFAKGKVIKTVKEENLADELISVIKENIYRV